jgi:hypothetical protein
MKKYNIGSPKRKTRTRARTHSKSLKKYNIGRPQKVVVTPDTPRSRKWKQLTEKEGYKPHEIRDYEPDESDLEAMEKRRKLGISTPTKYTAFEEGTTEFMREAYKKKPLTDVVEQVDEEAWERKLDDTPRRRSRSRSRIRSRSRSRIRSRSRSRSRSRMRTRKRN